MWNGPLKPASDAYIIDSSEIGIEEAPKMMTEYADFLNKLFFNF